jgi:predicted dehydrogenase
MMEQQTAVIGCGRMGKIRAWAASLAGAKVVAVCDSDEKAATELAGQYPGCVPLSDYRALNWEDLAAVFVCTPPYQRLEIVLHAIRQHVPILMEKPIGLSYDRIAPIREELSAQPVVTAVGYMNRYRKSVQDARHELSVKRILGGTAHWVNGRYKVPWWSETTMSGGPINEQATHVVDLARYLIGEIVEVQAFGERTLSNWNEFDTVSFQLRFRDGALFSAFYSCAATCKMIGLRVFTEENEIQLDGWDFQRPGDHSPSQHPKSDVNDIFRVEVAAFLAAVSTHNVSTIYADFEDAAKTQLVVDTLGRSLQSGRATLVTRQ